MTISVRQGLPARREDVWIRRTSEESALLNPRTGAVFLLNDTALAIWDLCDGDTRPEEMVEAVVELCGMHPDIVNEDIARILGDFDDAELISWKGAN